MRALPLPRANAKMEMKLLSVVGRDSVEPVVGRDSVEPLVGRDSVEPLVGRDSVEPVVGRDSVEPEGDVASVAPGSTESRPTDACASAVSGGRHKISYLRFAQSWGARAPSRAGFGASPKHASGEERAFTLIELLVVIVIIAVLMGLAFPVFQGVQNQAKRTQTRNDLTQIVTAVNAYYTEYGRYPLTPTNPADTTYGTIPTNEQLFNELRSVTAMQNPRGIVFLSPPDVKDVNNPRAGISSAPATAGQYFDPWGKPYLIRIDTDYDNQVNNPYAQNAGGAPLLRSGVIAWSFGKDAVSQSASTPADKNTGANKDDVISWQ